MALDTDITIPELPSSTSESNNDLILLTQPNAQAETGYSSAKATTEVVAKKILGGIEFPTDLSGFPQNEQNPFDALNYLKQKIDAIYPVETVSGAIATFNTPLEMPLVSCKAQIVPKETGTGTKSPSNPYTISGVSSVVVTRCGVNIWDEETELGSIDANGDLIPETTTLRSKNLIKVNPNTSYYFLGAGSNGYIYGYDKNGAFSGWISGQINNNTFKTGATTYYLRFRMASGYGTTYLNNMGIMSDTSKTAYEPYSATTHTIALGQTVYGGEVDVVSGQGNTYAKYKLRDLGTFSRYTNFFVINIGNLGFNNTDHYKCETFNNVGLKYDSAMQQQPNYSLGYSATSLKFRYDDSTDINSFLEAVGDSIIVFELATPTPISTTPTQITTKSGVNNIYADTGDIEVSFKQGVQEYIDKKIAETQALVL